MLERFKQRAKADGKSAEQLAREVIAEKGMPSREELIRRIDEIRQSAKPIDMETARRLWAEHIAERDARPFDPTFDDNH
ncbi:MAG: hypothetical protein Q8Q62_10565 [Mesorhizobium sp.]|nr:hypothetical protein [Mesorhizobium sp.]